MGFTSFVPGDLVTFPDDLIKLWPELSPQKHTKKSRYAVVIQEATSAGSPAWAVLLVCPIQSDHKAVTNFDVLIPVGTIKALDTDSWVVIPSLQPMLKIDVKGSHGTLPLRNMAEINRAVAFYTGILDFAWQLSDPPVP